MALYSSSPVIIAFAISLNIFPQSVVTTVVGTDWIVPSAISDPLEIPLSVHSVIAFDSKGNLFIADGFNRAVFKVTPNHVVSIFAGNGLTGIPQNGVARNQPIPFAKSPAVDSQDNVYITDGPHVLKITPEGILTRIGGGGASTADGVPALSANMYIDFITVDSQDNVLFSEAGRQRVRMITKDGRVQTVAGNGRAGFSGDGAAATLASLSYPFGLATGPDGSIYIAEQVNNRIRRVRPDKTIETFAGNGVQGDDGDGGSARNASLYAPFSLARDRAGNVYIGEYFGRVRRVSPGGVIETIAGTFFGSGGDDGPAVNSALRYWPALAPAPDGTLYIGNDGRIRQIGADSIIRTVMGNGGWRYFPPGVAAATGYLTSPRDVAVSPSGGLSITDAHLGGAAYAITAAGGLNVIGGRLWGIPGSNVALEAGLNNVQQVAHESNGSVLLSLPCNVVRITAAGALEMVVGSGLCGFSGDGAGAVNAALSAGAGLAAANGELFIADPINFRIRKVDRAGIISTIAGTGVRGASGDGGPARQAQVGYVERLAVDTAGNLYFADSSNYRIRRISPAGIISSVAGIGRPGNSGDGAAATLAAIGYVKGLAVDSAQNIYFTDSTSNTLRRINAAGTISRIAGTGVAGFSGDGGSPLSATFRDLSGVAVDSSGTVFLADTGNERIRAILPSSPAVSASTDRLNFPSISPNSFATAAVRLSGNVSGISYSTTVTPQSGGRNWLQLNPSTGTVPSSLNVTVDSSGLAAGTYSATIAIATPQATPSSRQIAVSMTVVADLPPKLAIGTQAVSLSAALSSSPVVSNVSLSNTGGGTLRFQTAVRTASGGQWLRVSPANGEISGNNQSAIVVTADPAGLGQGSYTGTLTVTSGTTSVDVPLTFALGDRLARILLSQTGLSFTAVSEGGAPGRQSFGVLNEGAGILEYVAKASTLSGGDWLKLENAANRVARPLLDVAFVAVEVDPRGLRPGDYYGQVTLTAALADSPQLVTIVLKVLPPGTNPGPELRPTGLVFTGLEGTSPESQEVGVTNLTKSVISYVSNSLTFDGAPWVSHIPAASSITPNQPGRIVVLPQFRNLSPGVKRGAITMIFGDGLTRTVNLLTVVAPSAATTGKSGKREAASCRSDVLNISFLNLLESNDVRAVSIGQPMPLEFKVVDDCGNLMKGNERNVNAAVFAKFSNGDPDLKLVPIGDGVWTGTWTPVNRGQSAVTISGVAVLVEGLRVQGGRIDRSVSVSAATAPPIIRAGSLYNGASQRNNLPVAPGTLVTIYGENLSESRTIPTGSPLPLAVDGTEVLLGGRALPILFSSANQINAQIPFDLAVNTTHQVVVRRKEQLSVPEVFSVAAAQPGIFSLNQTGDGQGIVIGESGGLASPAQPATRGSAVVIYCAGLGSVSPFVTEGSQAPAEPLARTTAAVSVEIGGKPAQVLFSGLTPGFAGLYQVNAIVPVDAPVGDAVELSLKIAGQTSNRVTLAVK